MEQGEWKNPSREHGAVYHAAPWCQAASLSLTPRCLHGQKKACSVEGQKTDGFASQEKTLLSRFGSMESLGLLKDRRIIGLVRLEHGEKHACPNVRQSTNSDAMTLPFCAFPLIVGQGPLFLQRTLPGKLMQSIPQGFDTSQSSVGLGVVSAGKQDRGSATERLQTGSSLITSRIISDLSQQTRSKAFASTRKRTEDLIVFMAQQTLLDLHVIGSDLLNQGQELCDQGHRQACFRSCGDRIGSQARLMQLLKDGGSDFGGRGVTSRLKHVAELLNRSRLRGFQRWIGLQEKQRGFLLELGKQLQGNWVIVLEAGSELVHQSGLHLDQTVLIACQRIEFGNFLTIRSQPMQIRKICSPCVGKHIGINRVRSGSRSRTLQINSARIDRVDRPTMLQQKGNEQTMSGFDNAGHLLPALLTQQVRQPFIQLGESFWGMSHADRTELSPCFVKDQPIMFGVCPIDTSIEHGIPPCVLTTFLRSCALILWCSKHDFLITSGSQEHRWGSASFLNRSNRLEGRAFPQRV